MAIPRSTEASERSEVTEKPELTNEEQYERTLFSSRERGRKHTKKMKNQEGTAISAWISRESFCLLNKIKEVESMTTKEVVEMFIVHYIEDCIRLKSDARKTV
jgi:hypothetical protein